MDIKISIDDSGLQERLKVLRAKCLNTAPAFKAIGQMLKDSVIRNFEVGGRYSSPGSWKGGTKKWEPLSIQTLFSGKKSKMFTKKGRVRKPYERKLQRRNILIGEGHLMGSIHYALAGGGVEVGPDKTVYAAIHQFGGMAGRGKKVEIPARPYLVVQDEDLREAKQIIEEHITQ